MYEETWLVQSTVDRVVRVQSLAGTYCCVLMQGTLYSRVGSLYLVEQLRTGKFKGGDNPMMD